MSLARLKLTDEQEDVKNIVLSGKSCVVNACPGSGKTTLSLLTIKDANKKSLLLTFSCKLKEETRTKIKENNIECKVHSYNSAPRDHYLKDAMSDEHIYTILATDMDPVPNTHIKYDIIVLDEVQDMTKMHYKYLMKFIKDMDIKPIFLIIGDIDQSIYQFKGSDERYLTMCGDIFPGEFIERTLTNTFRLTGSMVSFINEFIYGYKKYTSLSGKGNGLPVEYIRWDGRDHGLYKYLAGRIKLYKMDQVYIEAPSVRHPAIPIKKFENYLVNNHPELKINIAKSDDNFANDATCENKIVMTNYHKVKGCERNLCIIFGFDDSYYNFYADEKEPRDKISNPMLVGITRADTELILIQDVAADPLPFLKMDMKTLAKKEYCNVRYNPKAPSVIAKPRKKPREINVTKLISHLSQANEILLYPLVNSGLFREVRKKKTRVKIPSSVSIGDITEGVSHLNGVAIPAYFEYKRNGDTTLYDSMSQNKQKHILISRNFFKLPHKDKFEMKDYLRLANIRESIGSGSLSNLNQLSDYSWLKKRHVDICIENMNQIIKEDDLEFEYKISYILNHDKYGSISISGSLDIVSEENIYEIKCTDDLTLPDKLQIVVYAWLWKKVFPNDPKKFCLFNVRTKQMLELDHTHESISEIMEVLIENKIKKYDVISDEEFIQMNKKPIQLCDINEEIESCIIDSSDYAFISDDED